MINRLTRINVNVNKSEKEREKNNSLKKEKTHDYVCLNKENLKEHNKLYENAENPLLSRLKRYPLNEDISQRDVQLIEFSSEEEQPVLEDGEEEPSALADACSDQDHQERIDLNSAYNEQEHADEPAPEEAEDRNNYLLDALEPAPLSPFAPLHRSSILEPEHTQHEPESETHSLEETLALPLDQLSSSAPTAATASLSKKIELIDSLSPIPQETTRRRYSFLLKPTLLDFNDDHDSQIGETEQVQALVDPASTSGQSQTLSCHHAVDLQEKTNSELEQPVDNRLENILAAVNALLTHCLTKETTGNMPGAVQFARSLETDILTFSRTLKNQEMTHAWHQFETTFIKSMNDMYQNPILCQHREWFPMLANIACTVVLTSAMVFFGHNFLAMGLAVGFLLKGCHSLYSSGNFYPFFDKTTRQKHVDHITKELTTMALKFC